MEAGGGRVKANRLPSHLRSSSSSFSFSILFVPAADSPAGVFRLCVKSPPSSRILQISLQSMRLQRLSDQSERLQPLKEAPGLFYFFNFRKGGGELSEDHPGTSGTASSTRHFLHLNTNTRYLYFTVYFYSTSCQENICTALCLPDI